MYYKLEVEPTRNNCYTSFTASRTSWLCWPSKSTALQLQRTSVDSSSHVIVHATHDRPPLHSCSCRSQRLTLSFTVIVILCWPSGTKTASPWKSLATSLQILSQNFPIQCAAFTDWLTCRQHLCSLDLMALYELAYLIIIRLRRSRFLVRG